MHALTLRNPWFQHVKWSGKRYWCFDWSWGKSLKAQSSWLTRLGPPKVSIEIVVSAVSEPLIQCSHFSSCETETLSNEVLHNCCIAVQWQNDAWNQVLILGCFHNVLISFRITGYLSDFLQFLAQWVKHIFFIWYFQIWGLTDRGRNPTSRTGKFLERVNNLPVSILFICTLTKSTSCPFPLHMPPLSGSCTPGQYPSNLITPGPGTRQLRTAPTLHNSLKLFKLGNHKPSPNLVLPVEIAIKAVTHILFMFLLLPAQRWYFPCDLLA